MQKLIAFLKRPFTEKGLFIGTVDTVLKALSVFVWAYITVVLFSLFFDSMMLDYNPLNKMWWFSYCFLTFFGTTWLAYILVFVRDYYEDESEEE